MGKGSVLCLAQRGRATCSQRSHEEDYACLQAEGLGEGRLELGAAGRTVVGQLEVHGLQGRDVGAEVAHLHSEAGHLVLQLGDGGPQEGIGGGDQCQILLEGQILLDQHLVIKINNFFSYRVS